MFMEEHIGKNINVERSQELLATGAGRIATACPFCYIMIDDGVKGEGVEDSEVKVGDIALHLLEALDAGNDCPTSLSDAGLSGLSSPSTGWDADPPGPGTSTPVHRSRRAGRPPWSSGQMRSGRSSSPDTG